MTDPYLSEGEARKLDNSAEYIITADELLENYDITSEDVARLCPTAPTYGPASAPFWKLEDLEPLLDSIGGDVSS